ncbi:MULTISPECIES: hypothetical protein [unclassified Aureimonas]|uniref:hypothetical protein n=1 Tax=unclassified Aureimonas TaxID=2615206 RepID=UPI0006FE4104|nr:MULTISPECIES: hypothetical protein [unclassified Aureimonas]KQT52997.1 hypothetical protein ASG62_13915 [Aureimonas sp. Leaf427]KQT80454.1 hypothetical protein ASG54_07765 [Aureimonas sp. Leaf460]
MAPGTGFGQFELTILVSVDEGFEERLVGHMSPDDFLNEDGRVVCSLQLRGKLGDDETIVYEVLDRMSDLGIPQSAWSILWDRSDWMFADRRVETGTQK